jgi:hypothetical protein
MRHVPMHPLRGLSGVVLCLPATTSFATKALETRRGPGSASPFSSWFSWHEAEGYGPGVVTCCCSWEPSAKGVGMFDQSNGSMQASGP